MWGLMASALLGFSMGHMLHHHQLLAQEILFNGFKMEYGIGGEKDEQRYSELSL